MVTASVLQSNVAAVAATTTPTAKNLNNAKELSSSTTTNKKNMKASSTSPFTLLSLLLWLVNIMTLVLFASLVVALGIQKLYHGPITQLQLSFGRHIEPEENKLGLYPNLDSHITYYNRKCTGPEDITTQTNDDLMVPIDELNNSTSKFQDKVRDISMTHGALLIPSVLSKNVAQKLRDYLEEKYHSKSGIPWPANFWSEMDRLSLGLTMQPDKKPEDDILRQALEEVGNNVAVQSSLEAMLGPNPAIVEISTLTTMYKAKAQGIHTDSDFFGSSLLYGRTFLHSYTMFMALQDTTPRMGATTVCPGTHYCANQELDELCDGSADSYAFEASSNGQTGKTTGLFHQGDAFIFNQNVWHRGPKNDDPNHPNTNRVMFIMTFVSRREYEEYRDVRQLGWGTYYYMRWDQWGHSFLDLKSAKAKLSTSWYNFRKALGLTWNFENYFGYYSWIEHFARQLGTDDDFYRPKELKDFDKHLKAVGVPDWIRGKTNLKDWDKYLKTMMANVIAFLWDLEYKAMGLAIGICAILFLLSSSSSSSSPPSSSSQQSRQRTSLGFAMLWLILGHAVIALTGWMMHYGITNYSYLGKKITSGQIWDNPFPINDASDKGRLPGEVALPTTFPERMDVLIGSRFDAKYLGSYNYFLDYHPGNKHLNEIIQKFSRSYPLELAQHGMQQVWQNQPIQGVVPRMLLQDYRTGDWGVLNVEEIDSMIRKQIRAKQSRLVYHLWSHLKEVLADSRFGHLRESHAFRVSTTDFVMDWEALIFKDAIVDGNHRAKITETKIQEEKSQLSHFSHFKTPTGMAAKPFSTLTKRRRRQLRGMVPPMISTEAIILQEGYRVLAKYPKKARYAEAIIRYIFEDEDNCLIEFVHDGSVAIQSADVLQPYRPLMEGDWIEAREEGKWFLAQVVHVSPFGLHSIHWEDDGSIAVGVPRRMIRLMPPVMEGDRIEAKNSGKWWPAHVVHVSPNGLHDIKWEEDGSIAVGVPARTIRSMPENSGRRIRLQAPLDRGNYFVGQNVYVDHNQEGEWFHGKIKKIYQNGMNATYSIRYRDGEKETGVFEDSMIPMHMS